jgi:hypothetical protein
MTTDPDRRARIEFDAAAFVSYALRKEHTMREYCPHCHRELCPSEGRIFAGICIDCFLADKEPPPVAHEAPDYDPPCPYCDDHYEHACIDECPANPDTYDGPIPSEDHEPYGFNRYGIMVLAALVALALSLTTHTAGAGAIYTPTSPHNDCTDTGEITEFGGPILDCDGTPIYQDMDGQIYENAAGYPVYEPGTWVTLTYP